MPVFVYKGFNQNGKGVSGSVEALSEKAALDLLSADGVVPLSLDVGEESRKEKEAGFSLALGRRVPMSLRVLFARELATFIHADIPLLEALDVIRRQQTHSTFKTTLDDVHDKVQSGESFSRALAGHPKIFSPLLVSMVQVGETGGMMGKVLDQMATWMEHEDEVRREVRGALAYPAMILCLGIVTIGILLTFVLPRITSIFAGMEASLPPVTRLLMGTAAFMGRWWWLVILGVAGVAVAITRALKTEKGRAFYDKASLVTPIFGTLMRKSSIARFARASAALLGSGVPLLETLRVVGGLLDNSVMAAMVGLAIERVTRGNSLAKTLEESPYFPPSVIHLLGVGERTGRLAEMFSRVADTFEDQARTQIRVMLNLLGPLMIVALAVMVAFIAISILLPIFKLNNLMMK